MKKKYNAIHKPIHFVLIKNIHMRYYLYLMYNSQYSVMQFDSLQGILNHSEVSRTTAKKE